MRNIATTVALVAGFLGSVDATCVESSGNWYCNAVQQVTYLNLGKASTYNRVTNMNGGACNTTPYSYSGTNAPFDEEVTCHNSLIFRYPD